MPSMLGTTGASPRGAYIVALFVAALSGVRATPTDPPRVHSPKVPFALEPLRWGSVNPTGWLLDWATAASKGAVSPTHAAFHLLSTPSKPTDGWLHGRPDYGGFWDEDSAYWIDGMARLGLVLGDQELLGRVKADFDHVLAHPYNFHNTFKGDVVEGWVRSIYSRGMLAYYDGTGDRRILDFLVKSYSNYTAADSTMRTDQSHQGSRSMTQMEALLEGHAYGGPASMVTTALDLMSPASTNGGYGFLQALLADCLANSTAHLNGGCEQFAHGVTYNEVMKLFAMGYSWSGNASHLAASTVAFEMMLRYDMQPHGVNSADEDLNGIAPNLATETCDVSDFIFSSSWLYRITGGAQYGDRLEKAFHNAAPAAVNRSFEGHVYFQSPNYVPGQNTFGHPGDKWDEALWHGPPCCTGNQARMLPNYIHHMWFGTADGGLAATMYGPNTVTTAVGTAKSLRNITIVSDTTYPFARDNAITYTVSLRGGGGYSARTAVTFPLLLRVPGWTTLADVKLRVNGAAVVAPQPDPTLAGFIRLDRSWHDGDVVRLALPMQIVATKSETVSNGWLNMSEHVGTGAHTVASGRVSDLAKAGLTTPVLGGGHMNMTAGVPFCVVERGPLLFALPLEPSENGLAPVPGPTPPPAAAPPFNYALECDASTMELLGGTAMPAGPFDWPLDAPIKIAAKAAEFAWPTAWVLPAKAITKKASTALTLVPYGSTKEFRVSMFPYIAS